MEINVNILFDFIKKKLYTIFFLFIVTEFCGIL